MVLFGSLFLRESFSVTHFNHFGSRRVGCKNGQRKIIPCGINRTRVHSHRLFNVVVPSFTTNLSYFPLSLSLCNSSHSPQERRTKKKNGPERINQQPNQLLPHPRKASIPIEIQGLQPGILPALDPRRPGPDRGRIRRPDPDPNTLSPQLQVR